MQRGKEREREKQTEIDRETDINRKSKSYRLGNRETEIYAESEAGTETQSWKARATENDAAKQTLGIETRRSRERKKDRKRKQDPSRQAAQTNGPLKKKSGRESEALGATFNQTEIPSPHLNIQYDSRVFFFFLSLLYIYIHLLRTFEEKGKTRSGVGSN